jgi:hypothetical protein
MEEPGVAQELVFADSAVFGHGLRIPLHGAKLNIYSPVGSCFENGPLRKNRKSIKTLYGGKLC